MSDGVGELIAGAGGFITGLAVTPVLKFLQEPSWAREFLANISISRVMGDGSEWPLAFEFIGTGGWAGGVLSSDYIGWRNTGVGKGDSDAWVIIWRRADGSLGFDVYGLQLVVLYAGVSVDPREGPYLYSYRLT